MQKSHRGRGIFHHRGVLACLGNPSKLSMEVLKRLANRETPRPGQEWPLSADVAAKLDAGNKSSFFCSSRSSCRSLCAFWATCTAPGPSLWDPWCLNQKSSKYVFFLFFVLLFFLYFLFSCADLKFARLQQLHIIFSGEELLRLEM